MNRSRRELGRAGMVSDAGAPRCHGCHHPLHFGTDRQGRATESCDCGYFAYVETRSGHAPGDAEGGPAARRANDLPA